ncbi:multivesicular body subunit 12A isoform X1 [Pelodiscus sinensis]|uniref:multivesicular body subunit 12A isoform X1 n=1 Tax=Pelodiscus sinensis TaxID=13735 RepID=UPI003F6D2942
MSWWFASAFRRCLRPTHHWPPNTSLAEDSNLAANRRRVRQSHRPLCPAAVRRGRCRVQDGAAGAGTAHRRSLGHRRGAPRLDSDPCHPRGHRRQLREGLWAEVRLRPVHHLSCDEGETSISKKKRICMKLVPLSAAELVVFDIMLTNKSKVVPSYMKIGEISSFAVWCKKGQLLKPKPLPKPRGISLEMKGLSLETADLNRKETEFPSEKSWTRVGSKYASTKRVDSIYDTANLYGISAMDGVPFTLHPKFESSITTRTNAFSIFMDLNIKSLADIEKEYDYAFVVERTAAARLPPTIC